MFERIFTIDYILCFTSICGLCALLMLGMYIRIYTVARAHSVQINQMKLKKKKNNSNQNHTSNFSNTDKNDQMENCNKLSEGKIF